MNSTTPIRLPTPTPMLQQDPASNPATTTSSASGAQGFDAALHSASAKPQRKSGSSKESGGGSLPAAGNQPPPAASAPAAQAATGTTPGATGSQSDNSRTRTQSVQGAGPDASPAPQVARQLTEAMAEGVANSAAPGVPAAAAPAAAFSLAELKALGLDPSTPESPSSAPPASPPLAAAPTPLVPAVNAASPPGVVAIAAQAPSTTPLNAPPGPAATTPQLPRVEAPAAKAGQAPAPRVSARDGTVGAQAQDAQATPSNQSGVYLPATDSLHTDVVAATTADASATLTATALPALAASDAANTPNPPASASPAVPVFRLPEAGADAAKAIAAAPPAIAAAHAGIAQIVVAASDSAGLDKHTQTTSADAALSGLGATQASTPTSAATNVAAPSLRVPQSVDSQDFGPGVAHQVAVMLDNNQSTARLQVNPPALGPIEVRIALQGDHAQVWMASHSAVTRDALQSSSPHLKEMLSSQGFGQVSVDISHRSFQERAPMTHSYDRNTGVERKSAPASVAAPQGVARSGDALLDAYA